MHYLSTILAGVACLFGLAAYVTAWRSVKYASDAAYFCEKNNKASTTLKKMTELQIEMTEITDSVVALQTSLHKLRSRIGMRDLAKRREKEQVDEVPDPVTNREEWKRVMRQKHIDGKPTNGE